MTVRTIPNDQEGVACHAIAARQFLSVFDIPIGWNVTALSTLLNTTRRGSPADSVRRLLKFAELRVPEHNVVQEPSVIQSGVTHLCYDIRRGKRQVSAEKLDKVIAAICALGARHVVCVRFVRQEKSWYLLNNHRKTKMSPRAAYEFMSRRAFCLLAV